MEGGSVPHEGSVLPTRRPLATLATAAFVVALAATTGHFAGLVPGLPKTLPTFANLLAVTACCSW